MEKFILNGYTFQYADIMIYFNDQRYSNVLFVKMINSDADKMSAYDGSQLIVQFHQNNIEFRPIWNIKIEQVDEKIF